MKALLHRFFIERWQRKILAILTAIIVWLLMHQAITVTRTLSGVPIKVINLPQGKTAEGLLPSGYLDERLTITVVGTKKVIETLEPSDLEVVVNAEGKGSQWIAYVDKKSLVSKNPLLDLRGSLKEVMQNEFIVTLTSLVTAKIPVVVAKPTGTPPAGYQFLDVWPQFFEQTVTGPEKEVQRLKSRGLKLNLDLSQITKEELNQLAALQESQEEVSFLVPDTWKKVSSPFLGTVVLNDPESVSLRINFLKKTFLSLDTLIPLSLYFPVATLQTLNPEKITLSPTPLVRVDSGSLLLTEPLYTKDVSSLFLDVIRDHLQLVIIVSKNNPSLEWSVDFVDLKGLEEFYVTKALGESNNLPQKDKEAYFRHRFRTYVEQFRLFTKEQTAFTLHPLIKDQKIWIELQ